MKKRRGMTSLLELAVCTILLAFLLVALLALSAKTSKATADVQEGTSQADQINLLVESLQTDVKSASSITATAESAELEIEEQVITYRIVGTSIYRNSETLVTDVRTANFIPVDGSQLGIYVRLFSGDAIDMMVSS